jgi:hypothetical protein
MSIWILGIRRDEIYEKEIVSLTEDIQYTFIPLNRRFTMDFSNKILKFLRFVILNSKNVLVLLKQKRNFLSEFKSSCTNFQFSIFLES